MCHYCLGGCPVRVCAAPAAGLGGSGWYLVLCLSRFPLPAPRVPRCFWRAVLSRCPLPSLAGTPFHAVCAFRELGLVALLVVPACALRVCALALQRRPLSPPCVVWRAHLARSRHWALVGAFHVVRAPLRVLPRSLAPSGVLGGGRSGPGSPLLGLGLLGWVKGVPGGGAFHCCEGLLGSGAPPPPTARPLGGLLGSATHVLWARACGCGDPTLSLWPARPVGAACRGAEPWRSCARWRAGGGGGGPCAVPPVCAAGGGGRAGGRSASFRPSAFPGQATKRVSLASFCPWGAWPPIPLRFVLARLHWVRSVRHPGALARACLFPAVPVGAGGWGGGAGRTPAHLSGGGRGDHPPCLGGWGPGPPRLAGRWGGCGGGGSRRGLPAPPLGGGPRFSILAPLVSSAHFPPACACGRGPGAAPGWGGMRGGPWTAPLGAPADLKPPSALPEWAVVMGGSWGARPPYCSGAPPCVGPRLGPRVAPVCWCGLACQPRPLRKQAAGGAGARGVQVQPHPPPPPRVAVPSGGGVASPRHRGGGGLLLWPQKLGGGAGGGGRGPPPPPPPPCRASACHLLSPACPPWGILVPWVLPGGRGRQARSGRPPMGQCRGGGGGGGGNPPALVRAPVFPGPASEGAAPFAPSWAPPVRRWPAAARACGRLPQPWCPLTPGAAASSGGVRGRCFFGLPPSALWPEGEGGGWGAPSGPLAQPPDGRGGAAWQSRPRGPAFGWGVALFPRPPLPRVGPSCRPSLGPLVPPRCRRAALAGWGRPWGLAVSG